MVVRLYLTAAPAAFVRCFSRGRRSLLRHPRHIRTTSRDEHVGCRPVSGLRHSHKPLDSGSTRRSAHLFRPSGLYDDVVARRRRRSGDRIANDIRLPPRRCDRVYCRSSVEAEFFDLRRRIRKRKGSASNRLEHRPTCPSSCRKRVRKELHRLF